ncbi:MAG: 4'-phosphopantetheinyl transferase superfamily protein [Psychroflexus sp.]|nr:4'-phosphopantetheinyl transferase superfamily protein [Psychroflexus sp.]
MPIYKTITISTNTKLAIWHIEEALDDLAQNVTLSTYCQQKYEAMGSLIHRKGFLSIRHLLAYFGYSDQDLEYDEKGKPHLKDGNFISISHSFQYTGLIISDKPIGIDIEKQRSKIKNIAAKFTPFKKYSHIRDDDELMRKLTIVWCAKESTYKLYGKKGLFFLRDMDVDDFEIKDGATTVNVLNQKDQPQYQIKFLEFDGFTCAYTY